MKKILLLLALVVPAVMMARDLGDCQKWGLAPNDYKKLTTISYLTTPGAYGEGLKMPYNAEWTDCTIEGISVPVAMTSMKNLTCLVATDANFRNILAEVHVPDGTLKKGYNDIALDDPIALPAQDLYVGYTYTIAENGASLMVYDAKGTDALFLCMSGAWMDYSPYSMGVSALQVIIGSQSLEEYGVEFRSVEWPNVLCGPTSLTATVRSSSKKPVPGFNYSVTIDGAEQTGSIVLSTPIPEGMDKEVVVSIPFEAPAEPRHFDATLSIPSIGDAPNVEAKGPFTVSLNSVSRKVERRTVIEEFTGTKCGYCPKGWLGMETMKERYGDRFIGIAIHQYNADDPMYCADYAHLGFIGAPNCRIDRNTPDTDPYKGSGYYPNIMGDFEHANGLLPLVDVSVEGTLSDDKLSVSATANVEFLGDAEGYSLAYVLTADGLTGKGAWLQSNYYYAMEPEAMALESFPELAQFCKDGEKGQEYVQLTFGDVMIASSWNAAGKSLVEALPQTIPHGTQLTADYALTLPTGKALLAALETEQLYVVALVIDGEGRIANAARSHIAAPTGIGTVLRTPASETIFSLDGRRQPGATSGVTIVRQSDGSVKKVLR